MTDWYERRDELNPGDVVTTHDGDRLRLDHRVPGDGTDWRCDYWMDRPGEDGGGHWSAEEMRIHPGDIATVEGKS